MKTSSFRLYTGPGRISIARYAPRATPAGYRIFRALAPHGHMLKMPYDQYRDLYFREILGPLSPQLVWAQLHQLAGHEHEPVLLCWETLKQPDDWCHRRMVAEWFGDKLGEDVPELLIGGSKPTQQAPQQQWFDL